MVAVVALAALTPIVYSFPPEKPVQYTVAVEFDGFIPLFGGQNAKIEVNMDVEAVGKTPDASGNPQVTSELKTLELLLNGAKFPLGAENAKTYFPKTTISMTPEGKVLKSDAPDIQMLFRLPGLDVKRFPDITYLPLEFPKDGVDEGKGFTFKKAFGDSDVVYTVTPTKIDQGTVTLKIDVAQTYETLEDVRLQLVADEKEAANRVVTHLSGEGNATFDRAFGLVIHLDIAADANSKVMDLKTRKESERKLKTRLQVKARPTS